MSCSTWMVTLRRSGLVPAMHGSLSRTGCAKARRNYVETPPPPSAAPRGRHQAHRAAQVVADVEGGRSTITPCTPRRLQWWRCLFSLAAACSILGGRPNAVSGGLLPCRAPWGLSRTFLAATGTESANCARPSLSDQAVLVTANEWPPTAPPPQRPRLLPGAIISRQAAARSGRQQAPA